MTNGRWTKLTLRVASTVLTAQEITNAVSAKPTSSVNAGDQVSARSPGAGIHDRAMCFFDCPLSGEETLDEHIDWLVKFLRKHGPGIERVADKCELSVRIGFSSGSGQGGFVLAADTLAVLGRFSADMFVDLYPPGDDADDDDE